MSGSHCGSVESFPAVKELINKVGTSVIRGSCWDTQYFHNPIHSTCDQTFNTGVSRHGFQGTVFKGSSSCLHQLAFRLKPGTLSVFLCFCASVFRAQTMEQQQLLVVPANLKAMTQSVAIPSTVGVCGCFSTAGQHSQINFLVTSMQTATHPVSMAHESNCAHQLSAF